MIQKFYRRREVERLTGLPCSSIYERISKGAFPRPVNLGGKTVGWLESDLAKWQAEVLAANGREAV